MPRSSTPTAAPKERAPRASAKPAAPTRPVKPAEPAKSAKSAKSVKPAVTPVKAAVKPVKLAIKPVTPAARPVKTAPKAAKPPRAVAAAASAKQPSRRAARVVVLPVEPVAEVITLPVPTRSTRRRGRSARAVVPVALGSLTQPGARTGETCDVCGTARVTSLALMLTDGTPVRFTSCHACEHRSWVGPDGPLDRATVLERTRKVR